MLLHIGGDVSVLSRDILMILDLSTALSPDTQRFLQLAGGEGPEGGVKSAVLCKGKRDKRAKVYWSPVSSATLLERAEAPFKADEK